MSKISLSILVLIMISVTGQTFGILSAKAADEFQYRTTNSEISNWQTDVKDVSGLKLMYWNLECGVGKYKTRQNLRTLLDKSDVQPDILVLAEFCEAAYGDFLKNKLNELYPYMLTTDIYTEYHKDGEMRVYSKLQLDNVKVKRVLRTNKFLEQDYMLACQARGNIASKNFKEAYWQRPVIEFDVTNDNKIYNLVTVHLPNPWTTIDNCIGTLGAYLKLRFGTHNPTQAQASWLTNRYGGDARTIIIGDFNAPRHAEKIFGFFDSNAYKKLSTTFGESVVKGNNPTVYTKDGNKWIIDHVFASDDLHVKLTKVLPFLGSDHAALYTIIK